MSVTMSVMDLRHRVAQRSRALVAVFHSGHDGRGGVRRPAASATSRSPSSPTRWRPTTSRWCTPATRAIASRLLRAGVDLYELSPTRSQSNKRLGCSRARRAAACTPRPR